MTRQRTRTVVLAEPNHGFKGRRRTARRSSTADDGQPFVGNPSQNQTRAARPVRYGCVRHEGMLPNHWRQCPLRDGGTHTSPHY